MAIGWIPKATVQAINGGIVLDELIKLKSVSDIIRKQFIEYGNIILTTAVISIILTAPIGAILINTLDIRWLSHSAEEMKNKFKNIKFKPFYTK